jgi:hypothetical protein
MSMKSMKSVVECLADRYGFDVEEGLRWVSGVNVCVPFVKRVEGWCDGLKNNKGLFNQCMNKPVKGESLCGTCKKQAEKHGKPSGGLASERETEGEMWRAPNGKKPIHYGNYFAKEKLDQEMVITEMKRIYGMCEVSDEFFTAKKSNRGRPKKATSEIQDIDEEGSIASAPAPTKKPRGRPKKATSEIQDSDEEGSIASAPAPTKKPRGRPKKENKTVVAEVETGSDLIETLITRAKSVETSAPVDAPAKKTKKTAAEKEAEKEAKKAAKEAEKAAKEAEKAAKKAAKEAENAAKKAAKKPTKKAEPVVEEDEATDLPTEEAADEEEDNMEVDEVEINGVKYLIDGDQIVYDITTQQPIGKFDGNEVVLCEFEFEE